MFGFGKRKKYNGVVSTKLNNEYQIDTDHSTNPRFPGILAYLKLIDKWWYLRKTEDEAALYIAVLYYAGILEQGGQSDESTHLLSRITSISKFGLSKRMISPQSWDTCAEVINTVHNEMDIPEV